MEYATQMPEVLETWAAVTSGQIPYESCPSRLIEISHMIEAGHSICLRLIRDGEFPQFHEATVSDGPEAILTREENLDRGADSTKGSS
jgi:hypothetical protein